MQDEPRGIVTVVTPSMAERNRTDRSQTTESGETEPTAEGTSLRSGLWIMGAAIVLSLASTMAMVLLLTDVSVLAAFGFGVYCAFWLGGGFGTIFASAFMFGRGHEPAGG